MVASLDFFHPPAVNTRSTDLPYRSGMQMRQRALLICACTAAIACSSDPTGPGAAAGAYELVAANDRPLPIYPLPTVFPPYMSVNQLASGDLILRRDGTFSMGFQPEMGWITGQWRLAGESIEFSSNSNATITAELAGDALVVSGGEHFWFGMRLTFSRRRAVTPMTGRYALTSLMDASDVTYVHEDWWRSVNDSIWFLDEVFFRRRRHEESGTLAAGLGNPLAHQSYSTFGSYRRVGSNILILRTYVPTAPLADTVHVVENRLERLSWREVYTAY